MKSFYDLIDGTNLKKKAEARSFKIAKQDDEKMLAFGWANVAIKADGQQIIRKIW